MQTYNITAKEGARETSIGNLHILTEYDPNANIETIIRDFIEEVPRSESIGYAGFTEKEYLKDSLFYNISDSAEVETKIQPFEIQNHELLSVVEKALHLCHKHVSTSPTNIFLFPTFSNFVKEEMGGVSGYTPYKNTLLLFVSPEKTDRWEQSLTETVCHEFMHTVMDNHYERKNLLDDLVFEGIAESFVSFLFGIRPDMPSQALTETVALDWYQKLKDHLQDTELYYPVFLEGKEYPLWAGYALGYRLIEAYRKKYPNTTWDEIVRLTPETIHSSSGFGE